MFSLYTLGMFVVAFMSLHMRMPANITGDGCPAMGFALVYLLPAFYTDTTEGFVHGTYYQRLIISFAGVWSEMVLCAIATPIWWGNAAETLVHNSAHFVMMMCGDHVARAELESADETWMAITAADMVGIPDLKEASTAYTSAWVKKYIWRLPAEVPYVPKTERFGYVTYALASGAYSYSVLYIVARFAGKFRTKFQSGVGIRTEIGVALFIFRSRIQSLVNFMKFFYLDKKDRIEMFFTRKHMAMAAAVAGYFSRSSSGKIP